MSPLLLAMSVHFLYAGLAMNMRGRALKLAVNARYKRHKGSARVEGDEEEDGDEDIYKEFSFDGIDWNNKIGLSDLKLQRQFSVGESGSSGSGGFVARSAPFTGENILLLTYGDEFGRISLDNHALIVPPHMSYGGGGQLVSSIYSQSRPINPNKDISVYGYGSVAWKDRMDEWKRKQLERIQKAQSSFGDGGGYERYELENPDLPMSSKISRYTMFLVHPLGSFSLFSIKIRRLLRRISIYEDIEEPGRKLASAIEEPSRKHIRLVEDKGASINNK